MQALTDDLPMDLDAAEEEEAAEADSPQLALDGFAGPLSQLLALVRSRQIDLARLPLTALVDQLTTALQQAGRQIPLGRKGDWLVMAAWLVLLRSRLLLPAETPAQQAAAQAASGLRDRLLALQAAQALAAWLDARPVLGHDVFARGQPELLGTAFEPAHQVDVVEFLWASMALFDDAPDAADAGSVYRPPWHDLPGAIEARRRILERLAAMPDGASLEQLLLADRPQGEFPARAQLRRRSAWSSTFLAGLELSRQGVVALAQDGMFAPIHVRPLDLSGAACPITAPMVAVAPGAVAAASLRAPLDQ